MLVLIEGLCKKTETLEYSRKIHNFHLINESSKKQTETDDIQTAMTFESFKKIFFQAH